MGRLTLMVKKMVLNTLSVIGKIVGVLFRCPALGSMPWLATSRMPGHFMLTGVSRTM